SAGRGADEDLAPGGGLPGARLLAVDRGDRRALGARRGGRLGRLGREGPAAGADRDLGGDQRVRSPASQARPPAVRLAADAATTAPLGGGVADAACGARARLTVVRSFVWGGGLTAGTVLLRRRGGPGRRGGGPGRPAWGEPRAGCGRPGTRLRRADRRCRR